MATIKVCKIEYEGEIIGPEFHYEYLMSEDTLVYIAHLYSLNNPDGFVDVYIGDASDDEVKNRSYDDVEFSLYIRLFNGYEEE